MISRIVSIRINWILAYPKKEANKLPEYQLYNHKIILKEGK